MPKQIETGAAKCTKLSFDSAVHFRSEPQSKDITGFEIEAYTGAVVERWWGKLVVAVDGISFKQQMPIFRDHDSSEIVGYSTSASNDGSFLVKGVFSGATEAAKEVKALAMEGFPWQASIGVSPKMVLEIRENASMVVNGQEVSGPAEVWLESEVYETSFVPLGADSSTGITVFEAEQRVMTPKQMEEKEMDVETLKKEHPDLVAAITKEATSGVEEQLAHARQEGAKAERDRIQAVRLQLVPGHEKMIEELAFDGVTTGPEAAVKVIAAEKLARANMVVNFAKDAPPAAPVSPAGDESGPVKTEEEKLKSKWDGDADLQAEFAGDFEAFKAYSSEIPGVRVKSTKRGN